MLNEMAGCYHDTQDFKSDLNIEVAREDDTLEAGQDLKDIKCVKNPGHRDFIPFKDLTLEHLPIEDRNRDILDNIQERGSRVVRLVVNKMKNGRLVKETGSGSVYKYDNEYFIKTNNHVVQTDEDLKNCTVEFHYDSTDKKSVLYCRGVELDYTCPFKDVTHFTFDPVPDFLYQLDFMDEQFTIPSIVTMYKNNQIEIEEPIPMPPTYQIPFYSRSDLNNPLINLMFLSCRDGSYSYFKSCYFKFQPIPSNIQELTSIEIHIDDDDGISRVIPGDVVKFGDEFVVKISESIFQDEVKKCRLVWNGEVIGRGTRLYFQQFEVGKVFSYLNGVDLEGYMGFCPNGLWFFEFHPIPNYLKIQPSFTDDSDNMCCIGHPHGGPKTVTFGWCSGASPETFDAQYRHIAPNPGCQCKEVCCLKYSCKTCPGSSGSLVYNVSSKTRNGFVHFMGSGPGPFIFNGKLLENINMAWSFLIPPRSKPAHI